MATETPAPVSPKMNSKFPIWAIVSLVIIAAIALTAYLMSKSDTNQNSNTAQNHNSNTNAIANDNSSLTGNANSALLNANTNVPSNSNSSEGTSDWKTYTSASWGVSFKYPHDWQIVELSDSKAGIALRTSTFKAIDLGGVASKGEIYVKSIPNTRQLTLTELFATFSDSSRFWLQKYHTVSVQIAGISATEIQEFQEPGTSYKRSETFLPLNGRVINFSYLYESSALSKTISKITDSLVVME